MSDITQSFGDRLQEIDSYLDLLDSLDEQIKRGSPRLEGAGLVITVEQQRILYSSVYLQLYNLVESTMTRCIDAVATAISGPESWLPSDLSEELLSEWVRYVARTHVDLNSKNRLDSALELARHFIQVAPIRQLTVEKGGGGNWDDLEIEGMIKRLGLNRTINSGVTSGVKRPFRNDKGALSFIKTLRNDLAHGRLSFVECGEGVTVRDLRDLKDTTAQYLTEVANIFDEYITSYEFIIPIRRP